MEIMPARRSFLKYRAGLLLHVLFLAVAFSLCLSAPTYGSPVTTDYNSVNVFGFTTSGLYGPTQSYVAGGQTWVAALSPPVPTYERDPSANFLNVLTATFSASGWTYASSANSLSDDSLVVTTYNVTGTSTRVGAESEVQYVPHGADPTTNVHWIHVVTDNFNITTNPGYGNIENVVDNPYSTRGPLTPNGASPYYDDGGAANRTAFYDSSVRNNPGQNDTWMAELFLVTGPPG